MGSQWQVVGYSDDPIPDDPGIIAAQIEHLYSVAAQIANGVAALPSSGSVDAVEWTSEDNDAPQQFKQAVKDLPTDMGRLQTRYVNVASAMTEFNAVLQQAKAQAQANLPLALSAQQDIQTARAGVTQIQNFQQQAQHAAARQNQSLPQGQAPAQPAQWTGPNYPAMLSDAQTRFANAKAQIDSAVQRFRTASATAASRVNAASQDKLTNDTSWWHFITSTFSSIVGAVWHGIEWGCHWVASHLPLSKIAAILGVVAMVCALLSFIPVVGQIADVIALVAGGLSVAIDVINNINDAYEGKWTWKDGAFLALDAVATAVGAKGFMAVGRIGTVAADGTEKGINVFGHEFQYAGSMAKASAAATRDAQGALKTVSSTAETLDAARGSVSAAQVARDGAQTAYTFSTTATRDARLGDLLNAQQGLDQAAQAERAASAAYHAAQLAKPIESMTSAAERLESTELKYSLTGYGFAKVGFVSNTADYFSSAGS